MSRTTLLLSLAAAMGLLSLAAAAAGSAATFTHTLELSGPSTAPVGRPVVFRVTGTAAPLAEWWDLSWIDVSALPTSVVPACPPDAHSANQLATQAGGALLAISMRPNKDAAGSFTNQVGLTPAAPGAVLVCAYTVNEVGTTLSRASLTLTIEDRLVRRPHLTRAGDRLVCHPGAASSGVRGHSYRWVVNGRSLRDARGRTLAVTRRLRGRAVRCQVTSARGATAVSRSLRV